ncbi:hypothetical protein F4561_002189 [Lipingzhangella halophila]|uniref:Uncharacterized protein n=1 Tax=Lipingzhangella halophila TaxID=1783352 RepID=A0A7W7RG72_9ACTN|nr:hypothetical protein [Lipingzhangella halophila]MBB4931369.1 hypothetical protein [Lipingzhangella halophila]
MVLWQVLAAGVIVELAGLAALWVRVQVRERERRREIAARVDIAQVVVSGGRVTEYNPHHAQDRGRGQPICGTAVT